MNYDVIAGWVSRQVDIDECAAGEATPGPWGFGAAEGVSIYQFDGQATPIFYGDMVVEMVGVEGDPAAEPNAAHIVLHDPQHVLSDVKAKRDLLAHLDRIRRGTNPQMVRSAEIMTTMLAAGYRRRPGWRAEWVYA